MSSFALVGTIHYRPGKTRRRSVKGMLALFCYHFDFLACVQTSPLPQEKSGEKMSVNRRRKSCSRFPGSWGQPLIGSIVNAMTQIISGVLIGE